MGAIVGASITYRLAFGPNAGRKALTLQTVPVRTEQLKGDDLVTKQAGFSLHAGIACKSHQRKKLERLCRYITRPAIAERRLSLANNGNVVIALKTAYDDGTTHVCTQSHGVHGALGGAGAQDHGSTSRGFMGFSSPNSKLRKYVVPQHPVEEPENPKPKAYSRPGRVRMGAAAQACDSPSRLRSAKSVVGQFESSHLI